MDIPPVTSRLLPLLTVKDPFSLASVTASKSVEEADRKDSDRSICLVRAMFPLINRFCIGQYWNYRLSVIWVYLSKE